MAGKKGYKLEKLTIEKEKDKKEITEWFKSIIC